MNEIEKTITTAISTAIITAILIVAGYFIWGPSSAKLENAISKVSELSERIESRIGDINDRVISMEGKVNKIDGSISSVTAEVSKLSGELQDIREYIRRSGNDIRELGAIITGLEGWFLEFKKRLDDVVETVGIISGGLDDFDDINDDFDRYIEGDTETE